MSRQSRAIGNSILGITSLYVGALALHLDTSVFSQPESYVQEEKDHLEMEKWSSSLNDPKSENFNPFLLSN
jgi:hypothetical protein